MNTICVKLCQAEGCAYNLNNDYNVLKKHKDKFNTKDSSIGRNTIVFRVF